MLAEHALADYNDCLGSCSITRGDRELDRYYRRQYEHDCEMAMIN